MEEARVRHGLESGHCSLNRILHSTRVLLRNDCLHSEDGGCEDHSTVSAVRRHESRSSPSGCDDGADVDERWVVHSGHAELDSVELYNVGQDDHGLRLNADADADAKIWGVGDVRLGASVSGHVDESVHVHVEECEGASESGDVG